MKAGSYGSSPKSSGLLLSSRRSMARMAPSVIATSRDFPVRLSVIVSVLLPMAFLRCASSRRAQRLRQRRDGRPLDPHVVPHRQADHFTVRVALESHPGLAGECAIEVDRDGDHASERRERTGGELGKLRPEFVLA